MIDPKIRKAMLDAAYKEWSRRVVEQVTASPREHLDAMINVAIDELEDQRWMAG